MGLLTRLCNTTDASRTKFLQFDILSREKILIKLKSRGEIPIGPNPYLDHCGVTYNFIQNQN